MTSNFDEYNRSDSSSTHGQGEESTHAMQMALDVEKRDRSELLSAYLDGEVTAEEKREIEAMLATDIVMQSLHSRLLKLRTSFRGLPVPPPVQPVEQTVQQVIDRLERRPRRAMAWGGFAIAALFVGALVSLVPRSEFSMMTAQSPEEGMVSDDALMVAIDRPVIEIPAKSTVSPANQPHILPGSSVQ